MTTSRCHDNERGIRSAELIDNVRFVIVELNNVFIQAPDLQS